MVNCSTVIAEKLAYPLVHFIAGFLTDCVFTIILIDKLLYYGNEELTHKYLLIMLSVWFAYNSLYIVPWDRYNTCIYSLIYIDAIP